MAGLYIHGGFGYDDRVGRLKKIFFLVFSDFFTHLPHFPRLFHYRHSSVMRVSFGHFFLLFHSKLNHVNRKTAVHRPKNHSTLHNPRKIRLVVHHNNNKKKLYVYIV